MLPLNWLIPVIIVLSRPRPYNPYKPFQHRLSQATTPATNSGDHWQCMAREHPFERNCRATNMYRSVHYIISSSLSGNISWHSSLRGSHSLWVKQALQQRSVTLTDCLINGFTRLLFEKGDCQAKDSCDHTLTFLRFITEDLGNVYSWEIWTRGEAISIVLRTYLITLGYEWLSNPRISVFSRFQWFEKLPT